MNMIVDQADRVHRSANVACMLASRLFSVYDEKVVRATALLTGERESH